MEVIVSANRLPEVKVEMLKIYRFCCQIYHDIIFVLDFKECSPVNDRNCSKCLFSENCKALHNSPRQTRIQHCNCGRVCNFEHSRGRALRQKCPEEVGG